MLLLVIYLFCHGIYNHTHGSPLRASPPNLGLAPPQIFWLQAYSTAALFDELKASAYRCKKKRSVPFKKYAKMRFRPPRWESSRCSPDHYSQHPTRLGAFSASILPPLALATRYLRRRRLGLRLEVALVPKYFPLEPPLYKHL